MAIIENGSEMIGTHQALLIHVYIYSKGIFYFYCEILYSESVFHNDKIMSWDRRAAGAPVNDLKPLVHSVIIEATLLTKEGGVVIEETDKTKK